MIGRRGERGSGISVLAARHDDDDEGFYLESEHDLISNSLTAILQFNKLTCTPQRLPRIIFDTYIYE